MTSSNRDSLVDHKKNGKKLIPPLKQMQNLELDSWIDRLPEYLYAALLTTNLSQEEYLIKFRLMVEYFAYTNEDLRLENLSLTSLSKCDEDYLRKALNTLFDTVELKNIIKPLLLFENIPAYSVWRDVINSEPDNSDWINLKIAIGKTLSHNTQESTDIRWFCVVYRMASGKFMVMENLKDTMDLVWNYPYEGDLIAVMSIIRAMEGSMACLIGYSREWVTSFWDTCLFESHPEGLVEKPKPKNEIDKKLAMKLQSIWENLYDSFYATLETSSVDAKHDASFGLVFYSLKVLTDSFNRTIGDYLIGRIVLRSMVENYITLAYLVKMNKPELWQSYRDYGAGQAKLVSLKAENYESTPSFISLEDINEISNEDMREDFVDIDLGHWSSSNLRKMSIDCDTKEIYDKYYDWTSGYLHGNWGAIRDSIYITDVNPLHRLMRVPLPKQNFKDVIPDMIEIMNLQLSLLYELYEFDKKI
jgi:hypothetical protein